MTTTAHLWAIGYEDMEQAEQVRDQITRLGWDNGKAGKYIFLFDIAVVVRHPDGTFTFNRERFRSIPNILGCTAMGFLVGLVVAAPLTGRDGSRLLGAAGTAVARAEQLGISEDFIREVEGMMKPGSSALFVLDQEGDMEVILHTIRGLGGIMLRTNVNLERVKLIQSTLAASATDSLI